MVHEPGTPGRFLDLHPTGVYGRGMRGRQTLAAALTVAAATATVATPSTAFAGKNDLVLSRLGEINATGNDVIPDNQAFRSLVSEFGVVIAPKFLSPADTLGFSGFQFSTELSYTTINSSATYWCATEETLDCSQQKGSSVVPTIGLFARKGIWLPLPSFEVGAGVLSVSDSAMFVAQTYAKFALHEGFHDWPLPSLAARGAASRLMGSEQLDLTVASIDVSISKSFGLQGTVNLSPYGGWNYLIVIPRSEVIDRSPHIDVAAMPSDVQLNFVFPTQDNITRQRYFAGLKLKYYVFAVIAEVNIAMAGESIDDRQGTDTACDQLGVSPSNCDAADRAGSQQTYSVAVALDF